MQTQQEMPILKQAASVFHSGRNRILSGKWMFDGAVGVYYTITSEYPRRQPFKKENEREKDFVSWIIAASKINGTV